MLFYLQHVADPTGSSPRLKTNFEALLVSPYLRALLSIFTKQVLYFSLFDELQGWQEANAKTLCKILFVPFVP